MNFEKRMKKRGQKKLDAIVKNPYKKQRKPLPSWGKVLIPVGAFSLLVGVSLGVILPILSFGSASLSAPIRIPEEGQEGSAAEATIGAPEETTQADAAASDSFYRIGIAYGETKAGLTYQQGNIHQDRFLPKGNEESVGEFANRFSFPLLPGDIVTLSQGNEQGYAYSYASILKAQCIQLGEGYSFVTDQKDEENRPYVISIEQENGSIPYLLDENYNAVSFSSFLNQDVYCVYRKDQIEVKGVGAVVHTLALYTYLPR